MAVPISLSEVMQLVAQLPAADQRRLATQILESLGTPPSIPTQPGRHWREIRGIVAGPMFGEDAQAWVSRTRRESDEARDRFREASE